jgi:segregation and condensation protein B
VIKTLLSKSLVRIKGRDEGPGRPLLYATTDKFLENFGVNRISDLPKLKEITDLNDGDSVERMKLMELQIKPSEQPPDISPDDLATGASAQT